MELHLTAMGGPAVDVDEDGLFSTVVGDVRYEANTLAGLRDAVLFRKYKQAFVIKIPFTVIEGTRIRHGIALGVRKLGDGIRVRWEDSEQPGYVTWGCRTLRRLNTGDAETYRKLCFARDAAQHAVERFERTYAINLKDEIAAALAADSEGTGTE